MRYRDIGVFFLFLTLFSGVFYVSLIGRDTLQGSWLQGWFWLFMYCPGAAAVATVLVLRLPWRSLGLRLGKLRYWALGYGLPVGVALGVYGLIWGTGLASFDPARLDQAATSIGLGETPTVLQLGAVLLVLAPLGLASAFLGALGEELGWRGFLVPALSRHLSPGKTAWVSGLVWAAWHYPLMLTMLPHVPMAPPGWMAFPAFTLMVLGLSYVLTWLRLTSDSVWPAAWLHASFNLHVQGLFDPLTTPSTSHPELTPYLVGEYGLGLALAWSLVALGLWSWKKFAYPAVDL